MTILINAVKEIRKKLNEHHLNSCSSYFHTSSLRKVYS